jgi:hypothetical protein
MMSPPPLLSLLLTLSLTVLLLRPLRGCPPVSSGSEENRGCRVPCLDDGSKSCGCADDLCPEPAAKGQDNNRRWAVYEVSERVSGGKKAGGGKKRK